MSPAPAVELVVVVPAHDEEELLPGCLAALAVAGDRVRAELGVPVEVVVVLDGCTDGSAAVVGPGVAVRHVAHRNVGAARAHGFATAARAGAPGAWLVCTDADTLVGPGWLVAHARHAASGVAAVAGTVAVDTFAEHPAGTEARWRAEYVTRAGHPHVHGAALGVRGDVYRAVGGFAALVTGEDVDLLARVGAAGHVVHHVADLGVLTSGRRRGRVDAGFAGHLRDLADDAVAS